MNPVELIIVLSIVFVFWTNCQKKHVLFSKSANQIVNILLHEKTGLKGLLRVNMMTFLKKEHGVSHGFANTIAQLYRKDPGESEEDLVVAQYEGKENLKPIYDKLIDEISQFGNDVELAPKKAYVSVRRKKQFAILQPSTKNRFDIGLNIKGVEAEGKLEKAGSWNTMCTHRIKTSELSDITVDVINWIKEAYEGAG